jgi:hypothetical protein
MGKIHLKSVFGMKKRPVKDVWRYRGQPVSPDGA